jgi:predicted ATP-dependent endonuclease of OLD family
MIRTIELTHFGGYQSLRLDLAPVTVIVGGNASGKTTLLKAIFLLMQGVDVATRIAYTGASSRTVISNEALASITLQHGNWNTLFTQTNTSSASHFAVEGIFDETRWITKALLASQKVDGAPPHVTVELESLIVKDSGRKPVQGSSSTLIGHVSQLSFNENYLSDDELHNVSCSGSQSELVRNWLIRFDEQAIERLNRILREVAQAEIISRTSLSDAQAGTPLAVHFCREGNTFEIQSANHALVSLLALLSEVEMQLARSTVTNECVLLLDEPETHLNPRVQATIAEYIAEISRAASAQVILVTHSDHIVHRLWQHSDSAILNIERPFSRFRQLQSQKDVLKALGRTRDLSLYSAVNFLATRRVLFVEGSTDKTILQQCAIAHLGKSPDSFDKFNAWTCVSLDGVANVPTADLVERLVSSSILPHLEHSEILVVVCVLDRDYDKKPIHDIQSGPQVERINHVWSRHSVESLFVEADILESIILSELGDAAPLDLKEQIHAAISAANADENLREGAEDELAEYFRRTRQYSGKESQAKARQQVRANPEIWQRGKDRAAFVLQHIRAGLPVALQNKVRATISKNLEALTPKQLQTVRVPDEIAFLLDDLVARSKA